MRLAIQRRNYRSTARVIPAWGRAAAGFRELAAEASVALSDVLYVGDQPEDKQSAAAAGVSIRLG